VVRERHGADGALAVEQPHAAIAELRALARAEDPTVGGVSCPVEATVVVEVARVGGVAEAALGERGEVEPRPALLLVVRVGYGSGDVGVDQRIHRRDDGVGFGWEHEPRIADVESGGRGVTATGLSP